MRKEVLCEIFDKDYYYQKDYLYDDVIECLNVLNKKYKIFFVTLGSETNLKNKDKFLKSVFPGVRYTLIGLDEETHKDKSCVDMRNGIFVDDVYNNLLTSNASEKIIFGQEYEWNRDNKENFVRFESWKELTKHLL